MGFRVEEELLTNSPISLSLAITSLEGNAYLFSKLVYSRLSQILSVRTGNGADTNVYGVHARRRANS